MEKPRRPASEHGDSLEQYRAALTRYFARRVAEPSEVDDLVQEAFARLVSHNNRGGRPDSAEAWLFRVARNLVADYYRRKAKSAHQAVEDQELPGERARQEDERLLADVQYLLEAALEELSENCRAVFVMSRFDDLDTAQIARRLGISRRMVKNISCKR